MIKKRTRQIRNLSLYALAACIALPAAAVQVMTVSIDLRPDDPPPTLVAPRSQGMLPVGILTTTSFDATTIAVATIRLGPKGAAPVRVNRADIDRDGDTDLQLFFAVQELGVTCGDKTLVLRARTTGGQEIEGSESIVTEGCK